MSNVSPSPMAGPRLLVPGAALLLLISSFLPWYHVSVKGLGSAGQNGWHDFGPVVFIFAILLLAFEAVRLAGVLPLDAGRSDLIGLGLAAATLLFGIIFVILRFAGAGDPSTSDALGINVSAHPGWGLYVGLVALIVLGCGAFLAYKNGGAMSAMKNLQAQAQAQRGDDNPPPPPPPAAPPAPPTQPGPPTPPPAGPPTV